MFTKLNELTIEVNQRCPNSCLFCSSLSSSNSTIMLSVEEIESVSNQARELGLKKVCISGGEPLCHPDIIKIINILNQQKIEIHFYTCGIIIEPKNNILAYEDWSSFKQKNVILIFNIQSTVDKIHNRIVRCEGSLQLSIQSLLSAKKNGINIQVHIVPNKINLDTIESTVHDLYKMGVDKVSFLRLVPQGYGRINSNELILDKKELEQLKTVFNRLSNYSFGSMSLRFGIPFSGFINKPLQCNAGRNKLIIRYDGKVLPCEAFKDCGFSKFILGDIRQDTLNEILNKSNELHELEDLKQNTSNKDTCPAQFLHFIPYLAQIRHN